MLNYGDKKVMSKFQTYFDAYQAALLAVGVYQQFYTMEDLNKAADDTMSITWTITLSAS